MSKYVYPAIFESNELGGFCVFFPDLENVFTQGEDLPHAMEMAEDVLCLMLYDMEKNGVEIPKPSKKGDVKVKEGDIVNLVACDTQFYKNYFEGKSVKINATIPLWLKEAGEKKHVNFSQILQKGVKEYLHLP
ncbi:MAG: type II toxin-antitoxin system HicB family antitoxin [Defluviitaleaceae bacterium]|nr:type II toxin-antitoxin system HicB family antitoxin [Defluviitaleaceae bacterium]